MNKTLKTFLEFYGTLCPKTQFFIKTSVITFLTLLVTVIVIPFTQNYYLLLLFEDVLLASRSLLACGITLAIFFEYLGKK
ncbi:MAG: hypothetical protein E7533_08565 [Ruminococcaceae bacterium]|nr:hypothetical protein [Oscillospiraceae bacterium]